MRFYVAHLDDDEIAQIPITVFEYIIMSGSSIPAGA